MGLFSLFDPKWKHAHPEVRRQAVGEIDDPATLADIVMSDPDQEVRTTALGQLRDEKRLCEIATKATAAELRKLASEGVEDPQLLAEIATHSADLEVRQSALARISDETQLARLATGEADFRMRAEAVARVNDSRLISDVLKHDPDWPIFKVAIERLNDQNLLANIARTHPKPNARKAAVMRLEDQTTIAEVARGDPISDVRLTAIKHLDDKKTLAAIARIDPDQTVRECAIDRIGPDYPGLDSGPRFVGALPREASIARMYNPSAKSSGGLLDVDDRLTPEQLARRILRAVAQNPRPKLVREEDSERLAESNRDHLSEYCARYPGIETISEQLHIKAHHLAILFFYTEGCFEAFESNADDKADWSEWILRAIQYYVHQILFVIEANGEDYYLYRDTTFNVPHLHAEA